MMQLTVDSSNLKVDKSESAGLDFDSLLSKTWKQAEENDVFKFKFADTVKKRSINGRYLFQCHLNVNRLTMKRKAQEMNSVRMDSVKKNEFNFTKINEKEKLFDFIVERKKEALRIRGTVIVNNAPIEFCSSLLVLELDRLLPQIFTQQSLLLALCVCASSTSKALRLGFNSAGANSSVNHSHWHLYYQDVDLLIGRLPIQNHQLTDWFLRSLAFELDTNSSELDDLLSTFAENIEKLINYITDDLKLAYNLFIMRCSTNANIIRLFVWPRLPQFGLKEDSKINPALCEFSGFFICKQPEMFENVTESQLMQITKAYEVNEALFGEILQVKERIF